jgi:hypothetical protein
MSVNPVRGETILKVGKKHYILCLTLGALAEIEETLKIEDLTKIEEVFKTPKMSQVLLLLVALLHGGSSSEADGASEQAKLTVEDVRLWPLGLRDAMGPLSEAFRRSTLIEEDDKAGE